jgi:hypothetical protein
MLWSLLLVPLMLASVEGSEGTYSSAPVSRAFAAFLRFALLPFFEAFFFLPLPFFLLFTFFRAFRVVFAAAFF